MSEEELLSFNQSKPYLERIVCYEEATTSTFIRKRKCMSYEKALYHNERAGMSLDVLNSAPVYHFPRTTFGDR